jgi:serine/threonine-protein kinase
MEVVLRIEEGPERDREFRFQEADNLLIGRQDPTSKAHVNISPEDLYVSRHHFTVEVRPPNCLIRDNGSANGTFVRRKAKDAWQRIDETLVEDGDQIKIGHTILGVAIVRPEPKGVGTMLYENTPASLACSLASPPAPIQGLSADLICIRCGESMPDWSSTRNLRDVDFMCPTCRAVVENEAAQAARKHTTRALCETCGQDVSERASADGRAVELGETALYLCPDCAAQASRIQGPGLAGYRLLQELGRGGMGVVYKVWHPATGRLAGLKQVLPQAKTSPDSMLRFLREGSIMGKLIHPALVRFYEAGEQDCSPFFVSEFVPDGNLDQFVGADGNPLLPPPEALRLVAGALEGLAFMHVQGYVHRDIKPENILLRKTGSGYRSKVADFGLARSFEKHGGTVTKLV